MGVRRLRSQKSEGGGPRQSRAKLTSRDRQLLAPLQEPAPEGAQFGVNRYLFEEVYKRNPHLRARFPNLDEDGEAFVEWTHAYGQEQFSIVDELMPPAPQTYRHFNPRTPIVGRVLPADAGVNVLSFLRAEVGTGEAGRLIIAALDERRIPVLPMESPIRPPLRHNHVFETVPPEGAAFPITITCANPDWMGIWAHNHGERLFRERYSIGYWWWEVDGPTPFTWRRGFDLVDEVWTASQHIADALAPSVEVPIRTMPFPVSVTKGPPMSRAMLGLPDGFLFMTMFDYASTLQRKNPLAAIDAFRRSFSPGEGAALLVKCVNQELSPDDHHQLIQMAADHPDVHVIDRYVTSEEKNAMLARSDCFVSLHRAEGFGLPLAEAMYLGKPTIATAYSGNLEFQNERNSYLVGFQLVPIGPDGKQYPANGVWAEPDVAQAAAFMRRVFDDQVASRALGAQAAADIRRTQSLEAAGVAMERRLEELMGQLGITAGSASATTGGPLDAAALIRRGPVAPQRSRLGSAGPIARRALFRILRPLTAYQREVDEQLVRQIDRLSRVVDGHDGLSRPELRLAAARAAELAATRHPAAPEDESVDARLTRLEQRFPPALRLMPLEEFETVAGAVEGYRQPWTGPPPEDPYFEFERVFRGSESVISERQRRYLPIIGQRMPVLDIGCGRGEFLELLRSAGLEASGVDVDPVMVARSRSKGLDVVEGDGVAHLEGLPDNSLGVVFAAQVIEHLPYERLLTLLRAAQAKLRPGGMLVLETVNPHSQFALRHFWVDPTHKHPLYPEVVLTFCRLTGFPRGYIWYPSGAGDPAVDRGRQLDYAVIAETAAPDALEPPLPDAISLATDVGELWYPEHCEVLTPTVQRDGRWDPVDGAAMRAALKPGMTVLNVGAHVGYFALVAAQCVGPKGRVLAIEASPENYALLAANVKRVDATQVAPVHAAAWRESGELELRLSSSNTGDHRVYDVGEDRPAVPVPALALDELLDEEQRLDFVLLDTQGSERAVLEGMRRALGRWHPRLQVEFWPEGISEFGDEPVSMAAFYTELGYAMAILNEDGSIHPVEDAAEAVERANARPGGFCTLLLTPAIK
jgi:FkbM family methyltransferase